MRTFNRDKKSEKGKGYKKGSGKDSEKPFMFKTTCDNCGRGCEVPFKPTSGKPIYCSDCFERNQDDEPRRSGGGRENKKFSGKFSREQSYNSDRNSRPAMFSAVCDQCGADCEVPFRPTKGKPVYCSNCFENKDNPRESRSNPRENREKSPDLLKKELENINKKLNKIMEMLAASANEPKQKPLVIKEAAEIEIKAAAAEIKVTEEQIPEKKTKKLATPKKKAVSKTDAEKTAPVKVTAKKTVSAKTAGKKKVSPKTETENE
jgi:CxxC-x17-CxxC domain-containing protein